MLLVARLFQHGERRRLLTDVVWWMVTARKVNTVQQQEKITFVSGAGTHLIKSQGGNRKRSRNNRQAQVRYSKQNWYKTEGKIKKILDISKRHHQDALNRGKIRYITKIVQGDKLLILQIFETQFSKVLLTHHLLRSVIVRPDSRGYRHHFQ